MSFIDRRHRLLAVVAGAFLLLGTQLASATTSVDWARQFGSREFDAGYGVSMNGAGNSYIASGTGGKLPMLTQHGNGDAAIQAIDPTGNLLWADQFGTRAFDNANATAVDGTGVYVVGETRGRLGPSKIGRSDAFLRKYSPAGAHLWTVQFGTRRVDSALSIVIDATNAYVLGTTFGRFQGQQRRGEGDMFLAALDLSDGATVWVRQFGTRRFDLGFANVIDNTGLYTTGWSEGRFPGQTRSGGVDVVVHRFATDGTRTWVQQFGTREDDLGFGIAVNPAGLFVGGFTDGRFPGQPDGPGADAWARRLDKGSGTAAWTRQFGGGDYQDVTSIVLDGSVYAVGVTYGKLDDTKPSGPSDVYVRAMDPANGNPLSTELFGTPREDNVFWATGDGSTIVPTGYTCGKFPGETKYGGCDIFAMHLTIT